VSLELDDMVEHLDFHVLILYPDFNILFHYDTSPV